MLQAEQQEDLAQYGTVNKNMSTREKIDLAEDIFANSTSREYHVNLERLVAEKTPNKSHVKAGGGIGLVNLQELREGRLKRQEESQQKGATAKKEKSGKQ